MMHNFGALANENLRSKNRAEIDWTAEVAHGRRLLRSEVRSRRRHALRKGYARPYFKNIDVHSPLQLIVFNVDENNSNSEFFKAYETVGSGWKVNNGIARLLSVSVTFFFFILRCI
jgi:hypothetical protein